MSLQVLKHFLDSEDARVQLTAAHAMDCLARYVT
jgi:hypothetical protein